MALHAAITLDTDWAPDFVIDAVAERLIARRTRATWFVTHTSPVIDRLRRYPELFELGIHPNFLPSSTQGMTPREVLKTCLELVPGATSMRTHGLMQSTPLLEVVMANTTVHTDVSIFLPHMPRVEPVEYWWQGQMLLRVPYIWEDDFEIERPAPNWHVDALLDSPGARIFNFHPILVYLNSADLRTYTTLKGRCPVLARAERLQVDDLIHHGTGAGTAFDTLAARLSGTGGRCVSEYRTALAAGGRPR
jgi:hypothetical protein